MCGALKNQFLTRGSSGRGAYRGDLDLLDQQRNLGMCKAVLHPAAWTEQADLHDLADGPDINVLGPKATKPAVWSAYASQLAMSVSKLAKQFANFVRREVR